MSDIVAEARAALAAQFQGMRDLHHMLKFTSGLLIEIERLRAELAAAKRRDWLTEADDASQR